MFFVWRKIYMCGIIGYVGHDLCIPKIISGLEALEYRGYDSAGIAYVLNNKVKIIKEKGKIANLKKLLDFNTPTNLGIAHTRWATHGEASKTNAHPHSVNSFTIVHNGIIENYSELKESLIKKGYIFKSETDTEVACAVIAEFYKEKKDILQSLNAATKVFRGSYAFGIICKDDPNTLYALRNTSPLIVATSSSGNFLASDVPAILKYTNKYILLDDFEIAKITTDNITIYDKCLHEVKKEIKTFEGSFEAAAKNGYEHFMLKEINEQDKVFSDTINYYFDGTINSLEKNFGFLKKFNKIDIVACGSAYHTGLIGKCLIEKYASIPVNVEVASEYRYKKCFYDEDTLVILVSQSGETADTLAALRKAKSDNIKTMAIVNVIGSSIAREADYTIYIKAGCEIAVATTKAYLAQLAIFSLLSIYLGYKKKGIKRSELERIFTDLKKVPKLIKNTIKSSETYFNIADKISQNKQIFFIGRGIDYALSMEGSLKLKEISYINSVAYQAGELKHGTISLIEKNTPVIALATDTELIEKTISNIKEVKARGAYVIYVSNEEPREKFYDELILLPCIHPILESILTIIPLQLLAYKVAKNNKCDIDQPRNLAKSVTVE